MTLSRCIRVANVAPQATRDQINTLFGFIGKIDDIRLYPSIRDVSVHVANRVSYIRYVDPLHSDVALHLTNTVFIDRALAVTLHTSNDFPDENVALDEMQRTSCISGLPRLHNDLPLPDHVQNKLESALFVTSDVTLLSNGLPDYPSVVATYELGELEEIRRTVVMGNISPDTGTDTIVNTLNKLVGEVKFARLCGSSSDQSVACFIEFCDQSSVVGAFKLAGRCLFDNDHQITIQHSMVPILKPTIKTNDESKAEIEEAMQKAQEQHASSGSVRSSSLLGSPGLISNAVSKNLVSTTPHVECPPSMRSSDTDKSRRHRSRSGHRGSYDDSDRRRRRSNSRHERRSRSRGRRRSRSRHGRRRSRSRHDRHYRSSRRSRSRGRRSSRSRHDRHHRSRSRHRHHRSRSRSRSRGHAKTSSRHDRRHAHDSPKRSKRESSRENVSRMPANTGSARQSPDERSMSKGAESSMSPPRKPHDDMDISE